MSCPVCGADICRCARDLADGFISGGEPDGTANPTEGTYVPDTTYTPAEPLVPANDP